MCSAGRRTALGDLLTRRRPTLAGGGSLDSSLHAQLGEGGSTAGDPSETFRVDPTTGQLAVRKAVLDFETKALYSITVTVTDNGAGGLTDTAEVTVSVVDVNEAPVVQPTSRSIAPIC